MTSVDDCRLVELRCISSPEGSLTAVEGEKEIPFPIERVYYLYDIPGGETRGGHAHWDLEQLIVSAMGSFELVMDDGWQRRTLRLERAYYGVYVPRLIWRELQNFSSGAICMVLASRPYEEADYIREYEEFLACKRKA